MTNKINSKYNVLFWLGLIFSCLIRNASGIYMEFSTMENPSPATIAVQVVLTLLLTGVLNAAITYFIAFIAHMIGARRYVGCISRYDFTSLVMIAVIASNVLLGIVDLFSLLGVPIGQFTASFGYLVTLAALLLVYFLVIVKKYNLNPVEKYNSFKLWFTFFLVYVGLAIVLEDFAKLIILDLGTMPEVSEMVGELLYMYGDVFVLNVYTQGIAIASICIYAVIVIAFVVLVQVFKKQASSYRSPEGRTHYNQTHQNRPYQQRTDLNPFEEFTKNSSSTDDSSGDDKVFDEFDI